MLGKSSKEQGEHLRRTCIDFARSIITGCSASLAWFGWTASVLTLGLATIVLYRTCFALVNPNVLANAFYTNVQKIVSTCQILLFVDVGRIASHEIPSRIIPASALWYQLVSVFLDSAEPCGMVSAAGTSEPPYSELECIL
jgi:hypothetical protein